MRGWLGWTVHGAAKVTRYVCVGRGFTEEWIDWPADGARLKAKYGGRSGG